MDKQCFNVDLLKTHKIVSLSITRLTQLLYYSFIRHTIPDVLVQRHTCNVSTGSNGAAKNPANATITAVITLAVPEVRGFTGLFHRIKWHSLHFGFQQKYMLWCIHAWGLQDIPRYCCCCIRVKVMVMLWYTWTTQAMNCGFFLYKTSVSKREVEKDSRMALVSTMRTVITLGWRWQWKSNFIFSFW